MGMLINPKLEIYFVLKEIIVCIIVFLYILLLNFIKRFKDTIFFNRMFVFLYVLQHKFLLYISTLVCLHVFAPNKNTQMT
jgi:hypothetical protein